ncbi:MAG TPA: hypothetical protein VK891_07825 [Euzebyales bacterium]|nr:hypothetical protein [Euzebyales bacterium]
MEEFEMSKAKAALVGVLALLAMVVGATIAFATTNRPSDPAPRASAEAGDPTAVDDDADDADDDAGEADDDAGEADDDADERATGDAARRAGVAALEEVGDGTVTEVEVDDDGDAGYEVEVRRADGTVVEVALDGQFAVVSVENDD